ncbi:TatD family hydrolase [Helicobacter anatolicus]|uniref:TatD family hydrolase n=1 Tax=Helicobacter anatolicus TaxID=2905874 RepID=UPI001E3E42F2|nr:TatD family hydrolase [Helicobacter anatolicus]MCE3040144.1 TatD family hydrolase [Helicobacter anatolicus]
MFIDTHCHLNDVQFCEDVEKVIQEALVNKVEKMIIPGADPRELHQAVLLAEKYSSVYFAVGIHPYDTDHGLLKDSLSMINHPKCVAIGECGLDYFRLPQANQECYKKAQKDLFIEHIQIALQYDKPLILHIREASRDAYEILQQYPKARGVLHCYNADEILLDLSNRFYYGIGGVCTFKNAKRIVEILPKIPLDKILLETDAPYLTPTPYRGERNKPAYIPIIAQKVAEILEKSWEEIGELSTQNGKKIFGF